MNKKLKGYTQDSLRSKVAGADPYELVQMLMAGVLEKLSYAKGAIQRKDLEQKAIQLSKASAIINSLRDSLDLSVGGDVAQNLQDLYLYMTDRLSDASLKNDIEAIDEVSRLVKEIKSAWDAIPLAEREKAMGEQKSAVGA
ncbi:MAG: flagellar export chaperone FliS [Pseudomonadota bacterium]